MFPLQSDLRAQAEHLADTHIKHLIVRSSDTWQTYHILRCMKEARARARMNPVTLVTQAHSRQEEVRKEKSTGEEKGRETQMITIPCPPS